MSQHKSSIRQKVERLNQPSHRKEKERYVRRVFDSVAGAYDLMNSLMSLGMHTYWRRYAVRRLGVFPGARVLDGCTGTADFALASAPIAGAGGMVVGFDFSSGMLKHGQRKINRRRDGSVVFLQQADALHLPYKEDSFDFATVGCGIRNLSDINQGLREIYRVLKPGGKFGCLDLGRPVIPVYAQLYYFYFFRIVPQIGRLVAGNLEAYSYLPNSLHTFPKQQELQAMLQQAGFEQVYYINLAGGAMALHIGQKPTPPCKDKP
jgi:demethylmenaquinone methyltransferase/2-methoxy-6-polyprenyl-1,4-benzoquinol methylase